MTRWDGRCCDAGTGSGSDHDLFDHMGFLDSGQAGGEAAEFVGEPAVVDAGGITRCRVF